MALGVGSNVGVIVSGCSCVSSWLGWPVSSVLPPGPRDGPPGLFVSPFGTDGDRQKRPFVAGMRVRAGIAVHRPMVEIH